MINSWKYTRSIVLGNEFLEATGNRYEYVNQRPYTDKKGVLPNGVVLTLRILADSTDYGTDKNTGRPRPTNKGQNFDATILNGKTELPLEFGDIVALDGFDEEHSFSMNFDLLMRFKGVKRLSRAAGAANNAQQPQ